MQTDGQDA